MFFLFQRRVLFMFYLYVIYFGQKCFLKYFYNFPSDLFYSYDNDGTSKDEIKERFSQTMEFVETYLRNVVSPNLSFGNKEKNKLTFEVGLTMQSKTYELSLVSFLTGKLANLLYNIAIFLLHRW